MSGILSILPCLLAAFGLGALLGWALKSLFGESKLTDLEESWEARLRNKESEWERGAGALRNQLDSAQTDFNASTITLRTRETELAECNRKYSMLKADLTVKSVEVDQVSADWKTKYDLLFADYSASKASLDQATTEWQSRYALLETNLAAREAEFDKSNASLKAKYKELEALLSQRDAELAQMKGYLVPLPLQTKDWEMKSLKTSNDNDAEIKELQRRISELEPLRAQTKDWELKYNAIMKERETETAKLRSRITELEPLSIQVRDWQTRYQSTIAEKDAAISSLEAQLNAASASAPTFVVSRTVTKEAPKGDLSQVEGIGNHYLGKLNAINLYWMSELLDQGKTKKGRVEIAEKSGLNETLILRWVNHIDLMRVKGVDPDFAELLEAAGVDSVPELARRNAENLTAKTTEVNKAKHLANREPTLQEVSSWIQQAKELPRVVTYEVS